MAASLRWILQLHKDVPKASKFYSEGLGLTVNVCTLRWAELESGPLKLALMQSPSNHVVQKGYSSLLSFTVSDINNTVAKLLALGAELDGPIKYEIHGKTRFTIPRAVSALLNRLTMQAPERGYEEHKWRKGFVPFAIDYEYAANTRVIISIRLHWWIGAWISNLFGIAWISFMRTTTSSSTAHSILGQSFQ